MWKSFHRFSWDLRPFWHNMASWAEKLRGFPLCFLNTIIIIKHNSLTTSFALSLVSCSLIGLINSYFRSVRAVTLFIYGKQSLTSQLFFRWKPLPSFVDSKGETIEDRSWWVSNIDFGFKYEPKNFTLYSFFFFRFLLTRVIDGCLLILIFWVVFLKVVDVFQFENLALSSAFRLTLQKIMAYYFFQ